MHRTTSVLLGALVLAVMVLVLWWTGPHRRPSVTSTPAPLSSPALGASWPSFDAGSAGFDGLAASKPVNAVGTRLLDGSLPPPLPETTWRSVRFGVVLVQYRGAQRAPSAVRSKSDALELAVRLAELAQRDFGAAVARGDPGSTGNAGHIGLNILEPAPNYVLFSLPAGGVGGPVDTPTGYWIVKNLGR